MANADTKPTEFSIPVGDEEGEVLSFVKDIADLAGYWDLTDCINEIRVLANGPELSVHIVPELGVLEDYYPKDLDIIQKDLLRTSRLANIKIGDKFGELFLQWQK